MHRGGSGSGVFFVVKKGVFGFYGFWALGGFRVLGFTVLGFRALGIKGLKSL